MFQPLVVFDDGRGRYPDRLTASVPRDFKAFVRRAADAAQIPMSELVRRAVEDRATEILTDSREAA